MSAVVSTSSQSAPAGADRHPRPQRRLQLDSIVLTGRMIYLHPCLHWRRVDANTDPWLREPGPLPAEQLESNRQRFYPELDWQLLGDHERAIKEGVIEMGVIEMFLKSLELIR